jgi:hypothetical protein
MRPAVLAATVLLLHPLAGLAGPLATQFMHDIGTALDAPAPARALRGRLQRLLAAVEPAAAGAAAR